MVAKVIRVTPWEDRAEVATSVGFVPHSFSMLATVSSRVSLDAVTVSMALNPTALANSTG